MSDKLHLSNNVYQQPTTTDKPTPTNQDIFSMIAATVEMYQEDKMTMDEALKMIVNVAKDVV